jgi:hypothetical protein
MVASRYGIFLVVCSFLLQFLHVLAWFSEEERLNEYAARNYTWPIPAFVPNTPGWDALLRRRIRQIEAMQGPAQERYDAWLIAMFSGLVAPNFTQFGWAVTKAPTGLLHEMQEALHEGFDAAVPESHDPAIVGDPLMVKLPDPMRHTALLNLKPYFEAWIGGVPLQPENAYGLRIYQNHSSLYMHADKHATHVISGIFHIDHSEDSEPWPLVI